MNDTIQMPITVCTACFLVLLSLKTQNTDFCVKAEKLSEIQVKLGLALLCVFCSSVQVYNLNFDKSIKYQSPVMNYYFFLLLNCYSKRIIQDCTSNIFIRSFLRPPMSRDEN